MSRTPNYRLMEDFVVAASGGSYMMGGDYKTLPEGSYVRPIELAYVPKHVLEDKRWQHFNKDKEIFVYTKIGIVPVPKRILRDE